MFKMFISWFIGIIMGFILCIFVTVGIVGYGASFIVGAPIEAVNMVCTANKTIRRGDMENVDLSKYVKMFEDIKPKNSDIVKFIESNNEKEDTEKEDAEKKEE